MATGSLAPVPRQRVFTDLGVVSGGALLHTYVGGTPSTPIQTFSDVALSVPHANPIVASAFGLFAPIYLTPGLDYYFVLTDALGVTIWDQDHISVPVTAPLASPAFTGTPTAPTAAPGTSTTQIATTAFVGAAITAAVPVVNPATAQGRLSLTTAVPVTTADVLAATTLRYVPYTGQLIALYSGTAWALFSCPELSIALPAVASQVYDVFVYDNAGTRALELLAWTNDTTRATALVMQDGVLCKTGALTRRYVGSVRTTAVAGQTEDSVLKRYVWNVANRVDRPLERFEATASWTYNTNTIRQANGAAANQVEVVIGVSEDPVVVEAVVTVTQATSTNNSAIGLGLDSTTTFAANQSVQVASLIGSAAGVLRAQYRGLPGIGRHILSWNEDAGTLGTTTFWGASVAVGTLTIAASSKSGLLGSVKA